MNEKKITSNPIRKVTINVPEEVYLDYKKALIDMRTTPTADLRRHMALVVEENKKKQQKGE